MTTPEPDPVLPDDVGAVDPPDPPADGPEIPAVPYPEPWPQDGPYRASDDPPAPDVPATP